MGEICDDKLLETLDGDQDYGYLNMYVTKGMGGLRTGWKNVFAINVIGSLVLTVQSLARLPIVCWSHKFHGLLAIVVLVGVRSLQFGILLYSVMKGFDEEGVLCMESKT